MKICFIISPIGLKGSPERNKLEGLSNSIFKPVLEEFNYSMELPHELKEPGSISDQIIRKLHSADLVIANLTGINGNVMYELAIRHFYDKPVIIVAEADTKIPFDISDQRVIFYDDSFAGYHSIINSLKLTIAYIESNTTFNNPITKALKDTALLSQEVIIENAVEKYFEKQKYNKSLEPKGRTEIEIKKIDDYFKDFEERAHKLVMEKFPVPILSYEKNIKLEDGSMKLQFDSLIETEEFFYLLEIKALPHGRTTKLLIEKITRYQDEIRKTLNSKTGIKKDFKIILLIPNKLTGSVRYGSLSRGIIIIKVDNEVSHITNENNLNKLLS